MATEREFLPRDYFTQKIVRVLFVMWMSTTAKLPFAVFAGMSVTGTVRELAACAGCGSACGVVLPTCALLFVTS